MPLYWGFHLFGGWLDSTNPSINLGKVVKETDGLQIWRTPNSSLVAQVGQGNRLWFLTSQRVNNTMVPVSILYLPVVEQTYIIYFF